MDLDKQIDALEQERSGVEQQLDHVLRTANHLQDRKQKLDRAVDALRALAEPRSHLEDLLLSVDADLEERNLLSGYKLRNAIAHGSHQLSIRERILELLSFLGNPLTRSQVATSLRSDTPQINEATIASTLSKMVASGDLRKTEDNRYFLRWEQGREEGPDAGTSGPS